MKVVYEPSFFRDIKKISDHTLLVKIKGILRLCETSTFPELYNLIQIKKLSWAENLYRIRLWEWRIGIKILHDDIIFIRIKQRSEIYKIFP